MESPLPDAFPGTNQDHSAQPQPSQHFAPVATINKLTDPLSTFKVLFIRKRH